MCFRNHHLRLPTSRFSFHACKALLVRDVVLNTLISVFFVFSDT